MKILIGLGNPGPEYLKTRHNMGFRVIDSIAQDLGVTSGRNKHHAFIGEAMVGGEKVILAKPQTYMNLSGTAAADLVRYHPVSEGDILVIFDDMDLPLGQVRIRPFGGSGGQKGMASIISSLGTDKIPRLRLGIGRAPEFFEGADYVLSSFSAEEEKIVGEAVEKARDAALTFVREGLDKAMNKYNVG